MPLGDSLTSGIESDTPAVLPMVDQRVGYRLALYNLLVKEGYLVDFVGSLEDGAGAGLADPDHEGHGGFTQTQVAGEVNRWLNQNPADVVLLHIGTNDLPRQADPTSTVLSNINAWANDPHASTGAGAARQDHQSAYAPEHA
jgi:lysophospholipase L1-like esterase